MTEADACARKDAFEATERALDRSVAVVHAELQHGLGSLATIASVAPFFGFFGTILGIANSFRGLGTEKSAALAALTAALSEACVPMALGLLVALQSFWCYRYLTARLEVLDREMDDAARGLIADLRIGEFPIRGGADPREPRFLEKYACEAIEYGKFRRWSSATVPVILTLAWCVQILRYFLNDSLPVNSAVPAAGLSVLLSFGASWGCASAMWYWVGRPGRGAPADLAAAVCLCWALVKFAVGSHLQ